MATKFEDMNDKELERWWQLAQELRDGTYIRAIKAERNRRNRNE